MTMINLWPAKLQLGANASTQFSQVSWSTLTNPDMFFLAMVSEEEKNLAWAQNLAQDVQAVLDRFPEADPENVRHALILLQMPPEERLARSLLRGGARTKRK
jgi:hypothetical protein